LNPEDESADSMVDLLKDFQQRKDERECDPEWQRDNLEYDLRTSTELCQKAKTREEYAQNLYAALCNNEFIKNETWNILQDKTWGCSWRYAGGIVADMCETGDYIDWYCSGIRAEWSDEDYNDASVEDRLRYDWMKENFVGESNVTEEVQQDLHRLGWLVVPE